MKSRIYGIFAAGLLAMTSPMVPVASASAQSVPSPSAVTPTQEVMTKARHLAELMAPIEMMEASAADAFDQVFDKTVATDPGALAMEEETPGFIAFLRERMLEGAMANVALMRPVYLDRLTDLFARNLSLQNIDDIIKFVSSPTGRRLQEAATTGAEVDDNLIACIQSGQENCTDSAVMAKFDTQMSLHAVNALTPAELQEVAAFLQTPSGKAYMKVVPQMHQISADVANELMPQMQAMGLGNMRTAIADWQDMQEEKTQP